jgi:hypothetical protein
LQFSFVIHNIAKKIKQNSELTELAIFIVCDIFWKLRALCIQEFFLKLWSLFSSAVLVSENKEITDLK